MDTRHHRIIMAQCIWLATLFIFTLFLLFLITVLPKSIVMLYAVFWVFTLSLVVGIIALTLTCFITYRQDIAELRVNHPSTAPPAP